MGIYLGDIPVNLRLGSDEVLGYLGDTVVTASLPGAPTITTAYLFAENTTYVTVDPPANTGGAAITDYVFFVDFGGETGIVEVPYSSTENGGSIYVFDADYVGLDITAAAVTVIGQGPQSTPFEVQAAP